MQKKMKFEEALKRVEEIVAKLEGGETELEDSLSLYQEGIELVRFCQGKLDEVKKKVEILKKTKNGYEKEKFEAEEKDE